MLSLLRSSLWGIFAVPPMLGTAGNALQPAVAETRRAGKM